MLHTWTTNKSLHSARRSTVFKATASALSSLKLCCERLFPGLAIPQLLGELRYSGVEGNNLHSQNLESQAKVCGAMQLLISKR